MTELLVGNNVSLQMEPTYFEGDNLNVNDSN